MAAQGGGCMRRREFIAGLRQRRGLHPPDLLGRYSTLQQFLGLVGCVLLLWPLSGGAEQTLPVVGFLNSASAEGYSSMANSFMQGMKQTGYSVGENVTIEYRWADDRYERLPALAADLVRRQVSV